MVFAFQINHRKWEILTEVATGRRVVLPETAWGGTNLANEALHLGVKAFA
jgi:hypothetical protein